MKFFDSLKMALHNMWHNKSRTLLTVIIVLIVGTLLMALNIFALAFYGNMDMVFRKVFAEQGTNYYFYAYYPPYQESAWGSVKESDPGFNDKEIKLFMDALSEYSDVVDNISFSGYFSAMVLQSAVSGEVDNVWDFVSANGGSLQGSNTGAALTSFIIPADAEDNCLLEGRLWNADDKDTAGVWVTDKFAEDYYKAFGAVLRPSSRISVVVAGQTYADMSGVCESFTVKGILDSSKLNTQSSGYGYGIDTGIYFDFGYVMSKAKLELYSIYMDFKPQSEDFDFAYTYGRITSFLDGINKSPDLRQNENSGFLSFLINNDRLTAEVVTNINMARMMGVFVIVFILFISFLILLLSVGSIANSIIISTDKNKKFIGLMKAMGLKNKGVNRIINLEASLQILLGVAISFIALLLLHPLLLSVMELAFGSIFKSLAGGIEYTIILNMPFYIPLAVFAAFLGMALLSARGSLMRMGKMDVIAIMSEVA